MNEEVYLALAHIAGEIWGTRARAHHNASLKDPTGPFSVLGYGEYFEILGRLKEDFRKEVTVDGDPTETDDGEDT